MQKFEKANFTVDTYNEDENYGKFIIEPLERGFGTTLGNSLRRVLLSSMPGAAVFAVKINGAIHEFSASHKTTPGQAYRGFRFLPPASS